MNKEINLLEPLQNYEPLPNLKEDVLFTSENESPTEEIQSNEKALRPQVKGLIEALLFSSSAPLPFNKIREVTDALAPLRPRILREILQELQYDYIAQQHSFRLEEIAQGYILRTCEEFAPYIDLMHRNKRSEKLSPAATEVLAIIAYKQPITRPQIDAIRGVDCSGTMQNLLDRQLIEPLGKLEAPGRPMLYGTTKEFLLHFGLRDIGELPQTQKQN
ncbi:MAG: SMC-Scp complex subunit ScpB [Parachlamydiaceae bacterium]|nr:SMC-Scp complex subunit ScpB [Parachlamydiaceae bacterium]